MSLDRPAGERLNDGPGIDRRVVGAGFFLVLLALLGGVAAPFMINPRLGVGAHTLGILGGLMLIAIGVARPAFVLDRRLWRAMLVFWFAAAYGNWANTMLAGLTGSSHLTPIAGAGTSGTPFAEALVFVAYVVVGVTSVLGTAIGVFGLWRAGEAP
jgi:hydroxylaminobenzene mutase